MARLSNKQLAFYDRNGFLAPIDIFTIEEAAELRAKFEVLEASHPEALEKRNRNNVHYVMPLFDKIAHNSKILDAVESLIGENILIGGTTLFVKEPEQKGFISWHQDGKYIGLEPYNWVTAWLALSPVTVENGCIYMWKGSHIDGPREHIDTFGEDNLLTRGQTVIDVPVDETVPIELLPGQLSLHHPWVVHGSSSNRSKERRIGFAIQSYIASEVDSVLGKIYVQQARGQDTYCYHEHSPRPSGLLVEHDIALRDKANEALGKIFYLGAKKVGRY